jgi:hypothetical protein
MRQDCKLARTVAAAAVAIGMLSVAAEARAGDVSCAWQAAPEMTRAALVMEIAEHGSKSIEELGLDNDAVGRLAQKCYAGKDAAQVKKAMMGMAMEVAAGGVLLDRYGILRSSLDRAWNRLGPEQKAGLIGYASSIYDHAPADPKARVALLAAAQELGAPLDREFLLSEQFVEIQSYYMGRSLREAAEGKF